MQLHNKVLNVKNLFGFKLGLAATILLSACSSDVSYVQKNSPSEPYKDYTQSNRAIIGVGSPIDQQQAKANATVRIVGQYTLESSMQVLAEAYNLAIRWGDSVRKAKRLDMVASDLSFDEVRSYIEDVYDVQIIREGDRRLLVLPSRNMPRIIEFAPGVGVTLSQVVRGLAEQCGFNLVITENRAKLATTRITTSFKDVDCLDAFDAVLGPQGLSLVDEGGHYSIGGFPQRQWVLNLYEPQRAEQQEIKYSSGIESDGEGGTSSDSGGSASTVIRGVRDLWKELEGDLTDLIDKSCDIGTPAPVNPDAAPVASGGGNSECGYVRINKTVGLVQMRAPQRLLDEADEIIRRVEDIASRRLLVEARIIAVTRTRDFERGGKLDTGFAAGKDTLGAGFTGANVSSDIQNPCLDDDCSITGQILGLVSTAGGGGFVGFSGDRLEAAVRMVEQFGTTYQLMQPTLELMDRQRAMLIDGTNQRYVERDVESEGTGTERVINTDVEIKTQFVGIQFAVAAQIADPGDPHTLSIQIPITDISGFLPVEVDRELEPDQIPIATTRLIDQKVRIRDGEIKVIGGLTKTMAVDKESGVPLMSGIPVAGNLFEDEDIEYENVEFVVLLRVKRIY